MTDTPNVGDVQANGENEQRPLSALRVAELQGIAQGLGVKGAARMRKSALIDAIEAARSGAGRPAEQSNAEQGNAEQSSAEQGNAEQGSTGQRGTEQGGTGQRDTGQRDTEQSSAEVATPATETAPEESTSKREGSRRREAAERRSRARSVDRDAADRDGAAGQDAEGSGTEDAAAQDPTASRSDQRDSAQREFAQSDSGQDESAPNESTQNESTQDGSATDQQSTKNDQTRGADRESRPEREGKSRQPRGGRGRGRQESANQDEAAPLTLDDIVLPPARDDQADEDTTDDKQGDQQGQGRKRSRNRSRGKNGQQGDDNGAKQTQGPDNQDGGNRKQDDSRQQHSRGDDQKTAGRQRKRNQRDDADPEVAPDDVLLPIAGILDVLDNYAFVRTSGYLAGVNDVYVSLGQVKKYGLRKGDAVVGAIRQPREGEHQSGRQKYNALVRIDTINGDTPDPARKRADFDDLTPLYPDERITLATDGGHAAQRMIDLFAPIGKGSRGLIVAPPKSGKSIILERIANAIAQNSPDTHLMLVLVDERPEEVTRLQRTIHGEVVASTFDMPAENHTTIAELAIERAKRLVELGLDVVVLLDSITQLCRAYNLTAPASGRIIAGGVDASALYPPKRFFGAARNVENGGSLTILATAMVETGSRTDEVILEEFAGTGNMELRLSREIADKRIFPAVDIQQSSTLHEEQLLSPNELEATWAIRRALHGDAQASLEAVLERISTTSTNEEFIASVTSHPISPVSAL